MNGNGFNVFALLGGVANWLGVDATLVFDGERRRVRVSCESTACDGATGNEYGAARATSRFGVEISELPIVDGKTRFPRVGDGLEVVDLDGTARFYKVCADAATARVWEWAWRTPGRRIVFCVSRSE
ncbi:MAG: hypothetical protein IKW13_07300 [Thermoguttaceae bacterium]|nr:hypothetical protein [Thermoguttaceae bacterium]